MKITSRKTTELLPEVLERLIQKPKPPSPSTLRKSKDSGNGVRLRKEGKRNSNRPETPLLRWKFDKIGDNNNNGIISKEEENESTLVAAATEIGGRRNCRKMKTLISARKLAAGIWRMQLPEIPADGGEKLGFQSGDNHVGVHFHGQPSCKVHNFASKDLVQSPHSVSGPRNGFLSKIESSFQLSNPAMEGATKWDPVGWKTTNEVKQNHRRGRLIDKEARAASVISALETQLKQAREQIQELETERRSSKKKLEHFLKKLGEERAAWRSREHEKVRAIIDDVKSDLSRERKSRQRLEIVNSKLVNELTEAKLSAKHYVQDYEKERKARELIEEVCDELAKEIGEDKAEVEALKRESMKLREEVDDERRMLQMAEVWREERVQMKLVDAKVALEERYNHMNRLIEDLESFLSSRVAGRDSEDLRMAEILHQAAASVNIQEIREFHYEPPNADDILSVFEDVNFRDSNERRIESCDAYTPASHDSKMHTVSPEVNMFNKDIIQRHSNAYIDRSGTFDEDGSEWETVSHSDDQGSIYSPDGSDPSVNKNHRDSNASTEWDRNGGEETPIMEISEVCSAPANRQLKKATSISRLWRSGPVNGGNYKIISLEGVNGRLSNGRLSNGGALISPDRGSGKDGLSPPDVAGQWSSPESGNPHITKGMKGCIEWPRNAQKNSLKAKLMEARMESQKIQLRQVLKQKI